MVSVTIGVCAYNEERNIRRCLDSILSQDGVDLSEILWCAVAAQIVPRT